MNEIYFMSETKKGLEVTQKYYKDSLLTNEVKRERRNKQKRMWRRRVGLVKPTNHKTDEEMIAEYLSRNKI